MDRTVPHFHHSGQKHLPNENCKEKRGRNEQEEAGEETKTGLGRKERCLGVEVEVVIGGEMKWKIYKRMSGGKGDWKVQKGARTSATRKMQMRDERRRYGGQNYVQVMTRETSDKMEELIL